VVARPIVDRLEQREDLPFAQNPLGELLLERRPADGGTGERQVPHRVADDSSDLSVLSRRPRVVGAPTRLSA
jgi:hypothetical protein